MTVSMTNKTMDKSAVLSRVFTFHSVRTFLSGTKPVDDNQKQRQTFASRASRNRSLYALIQKQKEKDRIETERIEGRVITEWDLYKKITLKQKDFEITLSNPFKVTISSLT